MSDAKTLPRPEDVLDESRIQYQAMTDLSDDEYVRLADDIRERGVLQPIITDESGTILDGHHRAALTEHFDLDESREPAYVVLGDLDDDGEKLARGIKQNVIGRDTGDAVKSHAVEQYIETSWDRTDDGDLIRPETDSDVAEKLGVSQPMVHRVVNNIDANIIYNDRVKAREYYEENPDASYLEVSEQVDTSRPTVTEWLKEDFNVGDDGDDDSDNDIAESTTSSKDEEEAPVVYNVERGDWWELPRESGDPHLLFCGDTASAEFIKRVQKADVEFAFADPPYNADAAEWDSGFEWEHDYLNPAADVVAVTPGIESIKNFMCLTQMPYEWSVTAWIDNGMTRGALGFGNWIYVALFTEEESIHCESQDIARVSVRTSESDETDHKGRKPSELMEWLLDRFVSGGTIVDPFLGSGTTLLTAEKFTESRVIGGELSPEFCEQILRRWEGMRDVEPEVVR